MKELKNNIIIKYDTRIVIRIRISIEWSWKKINCSISGDELSCKLKFDHVAIFNKRINLYIWSLNSLH